MLLAPVLVLAALASGRPFTDERLLLDRRLETLRRILPDGATPAADAAVVTEAGRTVGLTVAAVPRAPLENGNKGLVALDVSAIGRFAEIDRFFRQLALSPRLADVETLTLAAAPGDLVKVAAVVLLPYRPAQAPLPAVPEGVRSAVSNVPRPQADAFLRDQALSLSKSEAIATLRRARRNPRLFLSELAAIVRDRPVVLREATLGEEFAIRGLTVGEGSMRSLESRLERGFFRISEVLIVHQGACHRFEAHGKSPVVGVEAELPLPAVDDPFRQDDAPCTVDRDSGLAQVLRVASKMPAKVPVKSGAKASGAPLATTGALTLRLREMDLVDVVYVLHLLTGQAFVVDGDVRGRVTLDASQVGLDEVLALLGKAGIAVSPPGPLRRVSKGVARPPALTTSAAADATRVTFTLKRARVRDVLAVVSEADSSLAVASPVGRLGFVSVFASDLALSDLLAAVRESADLEERVEDSRRIVVPRGSRSDGGAPEPPPERRLVLRPDELSSSEFRLAGLASSGEGWLALAYAPTGVLNAYRRGDHLGDGSVAEVESTDVLLATEEGYTRSLLPDPGR